MLPSAQIEGSVSSSIQRTQLNIRIRHQVPITIVIPTLNEALNIRRLIESLDWAAEVIVADGGSVDGTAEIASGAGAKVLHVAGATIAFQRNAGTAVARNRWILALDADEHISDNLRDEIASTIENPSHEAYRIPFRNFYLGREIRHGRWGNESHIRLFQSNRRFVEMRVHEHLEPIGDIGTLTGAIEHRSYLNLTHHLEKMIRYSRWAAEDLFARGRRSGFWDLTMSPGWRFFREYVIYGGWRDGLPGLMVAALSGCAALLKYAQLLALEWEAKDELIEVSDAVLIKAVQGIDLEAAREAQLISSKS